MRRICDFCGGHYDANPRAMRRTVCYAGPCIAARTAALAQLKIHLQQQRREARRRRMSSARTDLGPEATRAMRPCLRCDVVFATEGPHHRVCAACKDSEAWRHPNDDVPLYF